jgi:hypothetical protein
MSATVAIVIGVSVTVILVIGVVVWLFWSSWVGPRPFEKPRREEAPQGAGGGLSRRGRA